MPRVIKFRAWGNKRDLKTRDKKMFSHPEISTIPSWTDLNKAIHETIDLYGNILMQFTGLHDMNGKEIYEGDIVKSADSRGEFHYGQVVYSDDGYFVAKSIDHRRRVNYEFFWNEDNTEIIGNIYENPEFLEDK